MDEISAVLWRGAERLLIVGFGGLSIVLGYRLFLKIPEIQDGAGRITFAGGATVVLSRVGPGVFFALFGATVLSIALHKQLTQVEPAARAQSQVEPQARDGGTQLSYSTGIDTTRDVSHAASERSTVIADVQVLVRVQEHLDRARPSGIQGPDLAAQRVEPALTRMKRMAMRTVWDESWGEYTDFARWVAAGAPVPPPSSIAPAARLFLSGEHPSSAPRR